MSQTVPSDDLLDNLESVGFDLPTVDETACAGTERPLNLNAIAIGLGLENVAYEPEEFPGLVYTVQEHDDAVAVLFETGTVFVVSNSSVDPVECAESVTAKLEELDLIETAEIAPVAVSRSPEAVPVPPEYDVDGEK